MEVTIETKPTFSVLGLARRGDANSGPTWIPALWDELFAQYGEQLTTFTHSGPAYGAMDHYDPEMLTFEYLAGFRAKAGTAPPEGSTTWEIPGRTFAVVRCTIKTIGDAYTFFHQEWSPKSGYERAEGVEFELYGEEFRGGEDDPIHLYFPIEKHEQ